jgi:hypothetical protein
MERYSHAKNIIDYDAAQSRFQKVFDDAGGRVLNLKQG